MGTCSSAARHGPGLTTQVEHKVQNLSACLRDEVGGRATNITNNAVMEDIYKRVAEAATVRMLAHTFEDENKEALRKLWVETGITRKLTKRSVD